MANSLASLEARLEMQESGAGNSERERVLFGVCFGMCWPCAEGTRKFAERGNRGLAGVGFAFQGQIPEDPPS